MREYDKLRLESVAVHNKMEVLISIQTDIIDGEYTKTSEIFRAINDKLDQLLLTSKMIRVELDIVLNEDDNYRNK